MKKRIIISYLDIEHHQNLFNKLLDQKPKSVTLKQPLDDNPQLNLK